MTVTWPAVRLDAGAGAGAGRRTTAVDVLPSRPLGPPAAAARLQRLRQHSRHAADDDARHGAAVRRSRIVWGEERCYVVRAVERTAALSVESEAAARCTTLVDTFPPAAPKA